MGSEFKRNAGNRVKQFIKSWEPVPPKFKGSTGMGTYKPSNHWEFHTLDSKIIQVFTVFIDECSDLFNVCILCLNAMQCSFCGQLEAYVRHPFACLCSDVFHLL